VDATVVPKIVSEVAARRDPELSVLSAVVHARAPEALPVATAAIQAATAFDDDRMETYIDIVLAALPAAARKALEEIMARGHEYQSDLFKRLVAEGKAEALLTVLAARRLEVSATVRSRILAERDGRMLEEWLSRAATVERAEHLFVGGSS
jgi:hypothetical protein